ncbi:MAG: molybdopterin molybdotransferase MoeA [Acidimicrobiales bacterium]
MIPLEDAQARVAASIAPLDPVVVPIGEAAGRILAEAVTAQAPIPPFDNTAMDGFAVRAADTAGATETAPVRLPIVATIPAGAIAPRPLEAGEAMRIMTGAPIPDGADAVVMVELTRADGDEVDVGAEVPVGNHIRPIGDDLPADAVVYEPGELLTAAHLGVLASVGRATVAVHRRPRVGVFSTGDELVPPGQPLGPGQIHDSNRYSLLQLVAEAGAEPVDLGLLPDDEEAIEAALRSAIETPDGAPVDALVTSGGVSMGDFDFVKAILQRLGDLNWMQVAIRPAKPLAFGTLLGVPIFGLPGNPVSSMVSFELFAGPAIRTMLGHREPQRRAQWAIADETFGRRPDGKTHFVRVVARAESDGALHVRSAGGQGSHQLSAMARANALAVLDDGSGVQLGGKVRVLVLR